MVNRLTEQEYIEHAKEVREHANFSPTWADSEARQYNREGKDTERMWLGEIWETLRHLPFQIPTSENPAVVFNFGAENEAGDKINPRLPFGQFAMTRVPNGEERELLAATLQIFTLDARASQQLEYYMRKDERLALRDIASNTEVPFFSSLGLASRSQRQSIVQNDEHTLPAGLAKIVEGRSYPVYPSITLRSIYELGGRTSGDTLDQDSVFVVDPVDVT